MEISSKVEPSTPEFRVQLLGSFAVFRDGERLNTEHWQGRVSSLFKLLVTAPDHRRLRDEILDLLWPDATPDAGAGNLRIGLHRLRQALGGGEPSPVISERGWVMLNPQYRWDVDLDRFESLVEGARGNAAVLEEAALLFQGEPLTEDRYDVWATPVRDRALRTWRETCLGLGAIYAARSEYDSAAQWYERAVEIDPLDEEALRGLLVSLDGAGRRSDALRRYAAFEEQLRQEMGVTPSSETMAAAESLRSAGLDAAAATLAPPAESRSLPVGRFLGALPPEPMVDRSEECTRLHFAIDVVEGGAGRLVLVAGEAGIGKTRLAQEAAILMAERNFLVTTGRCYERDRTIPFYPFIDVLTLAYRAAPDHIRSQLSHRWPQLAQLLLGGATAPIDDAERVRLFRIITDFITTLATERPLALLIDDLQWADEPSLDLLRHIALHTRNQPVLLLATYRDTEIDRDQPLARAIRQLTREGLVDRISLGRLSVESTGAMVAEVMGDTSEVSDFVEFVFRRTRGIPYFIERMLHALGGRYRLIRQVGRGGMGRVFEAVDTRTGRRVAAKILFARSEADPRVLTRFEQEGEVMASLHHPNIVRVYGTFSDEYSSCIVMEMLEGRSLGRLLGEESLSLARARYIGQQVAAALASAHQHRIVHRDIKPDNIMIGEDDRVKVTDFGIARMARPQNTATLTSTGMTLGTPHYMAPEQVEGQHVDGRADIYSLGAVLYRMVTGRPPFEGSDPLTIAFRHVHVEPERPSSLRPDLPEEWERLILKALAKDPADRFADASALAEAIRRLPIEPAAETHPEPPSTVEPAVQPSLLPVLAATLRTPADRRQRWQIVGIAGLAVAAVAVGIFLAGMNAFSGITTKPTVPSVRHPSLVWGGSGTGRGQFNGPTGAGIDGVGNVWVADSGNHRVQEFSPDGVVRAVVGTEGTGPAQFERPSDVAVDPHGIVYISDSKNLQITKLSPSLAPLDTLQYFSPASGQYDLLTSLTTDAAGNLYTTDYTASKIRVFSPDGKLIRSWGEKGSAGGRLNSPDGIAVDSSRGLVYVADKFNHRVEKFTPTGSYLGSFGANGSGRGQIDQPADLALDGAGNVYVADPRNHRVEEFSPGGTFIAEWGSLGSGYDQFNQPSGIAVNTRGTLFVTDYYSNHVEKIIRK